MKFLKNIQAVMVLLAMVGFAENAVSGEYHVLKSNKNLVKFISDAPVEDFEGVTDKIDGYLYYEGDDLTKASAIYFEVDLNSLDTGIGLRNRHMRENYLETDKYPTTFFNGKIIKADPVQGEGAYIVKAIGNINIHGVERLLEVEAKLLKEGNKFRISSEFQVKLSHFNIEIPSIMFYKINETMDLVLDFYVELFEKSEN